jgi:hypothetical protein
MRPFLKFSGYCLVAVAVTTALFLTWWLRPQPVASLRPGPAAPSPAIHGYQWPPTDSSFPISAVDTRADRAAVSTQLALAAGQQLREWDDDDNPSLRDQRLSALANLLRGADLNEVALKLPDDVFDFALGLPIFQDWIKSHPAQSAAWMSLRPNISQVRVDALVHSWEQTDLAGVRSYVDTLPEGEWREKMLTVVARDSMDGDPAEAIQWTDQLPPGPVRTGLLQTAVTNWAAQDPQVAMQWVAGVADAGLKDQLAASLSVQYARADPVAAIRYAMNTIQSDALLNGSVANIANAWGQADPAAAAAWVEQLPEGDARRMALAQVIDDWVNSNPNAAAAWIRTLPAGDVREQAMGLIAIAPAMSSGR